MYRADVSPVSQNVSAKIMQIEDNTKEKPLKLSFFCSLWTSCLGHDMCWDIHAGGCSSVHNPLSPLVIFPPPQNSFPVMPLYLASVGTAPCFAMRNVS